MIQKPWEPSPGYIVLIASGCSLNPSFDWDGVWDMVKQSSSTPED